nr:venom peptide [Acharia stimulea]
MMFRLVLILALLSVAAAAIDLTSCQERVQTCQKAKKGDKCCDNLSCKSLDQGFAVTICKAIFAKTG